MSDFSVNEPLPTLRHTVRPGLQNALTVTTEPNSLCELSVDGHDVPSLRAYSDSDGVARFQIQPQDTSDEPEPLVLHALREGNVIARHPIELRSAIEATDDHPFQLAETPLALRSGVLHRPALTVDEAIRLTPPEAIEGGFPAKPHPTETPAAFQAWLRTVTTPMIEIQPQLIASSDVRHGGLRTKIERDRIEEIPILQGQTTTASPATSNNWSGYERRRGIEFGPIESRPIESRPISNVHLSPAYDWISASWIVPSVQGPINQQGWSAFWVGLDGDGIPDLVQAGTEQNAIHYQLPLFFNFNVSTFWGWTEFLPQQPFEQVISNFPVNSGDRIYCEVSMGSAGSAPSLPGPFGRFLLINETQGAFANLATPRGSTVVGGSEAVWIMERPTVNGSLPALANYGAAVMRQALCRTANAAAGQGFQTYLGGNNREVTMLNGATTLSSVSALDTSEMLFSWHSFL